MLGREGKQKFLHIAGERVIRQRLSKSPAHISFDSATPLLGIYLRDILALVQNDLSRRILPVASSVLAKEWKQAECVAAGDG